MDQTKGDQLISISRQALYWILGLVGFQFLLFTPLYFTRSEEGRFWPVIQNIPWDFLSRPNPDLFRWCLEYSLIYMVGWLLFSHTRYRVLSVSFVSIGYLFCFIFQVYYYLLWKIYGEIPIFANDFALFERVLPVFIKSHFIKPLFFYSLVLILLAGTAKLFFTLHHALFLRSSSLPIPVFSALSLIFFGIPTLAKWQIPHPRDSNDSKTAIISIGENLFQTLTHERVFRISDSLPLSKYQVYYDLPIRSKPNILLIFIEAYGSVIGVANPYSDAYKKQLLAMQENLRENSWFSASALSNSTILGGRSWLGFTSVLAGIRIDNHPSYEKLLSKYTEYPHWIDWLNHKGYQTYRLNTMANPGKDFQALDAIADTFYKIKFWTKYSDIPYQGYRYDYLGGIPDQYALHYWDETVLNRSELPYFLFFITLNTHAPFYLPPPVLADWHALDTIHTSPHRSDRIEKGKPIARYALEVNYIFQVLEKYILEKTDSNTLFILMGDHQPAGMEYLLHGKTDVYATPIHIISKDSSWINAFNRNGFQAGMLPHFTRPSLLRHEGFYSYFIKIWAEHDRLDTNLPIYPKGLQ
jgi:hypothetical protein